MKKVIFGTLIALSVWSCDSKKDEVTPTTDTTEYQVDFTLNGVDLAVKDMKPQANLKGMPAEGEELNLDVVLVAYGTDKTGAKTGTIIPYQFEDQSFSVGVSKKFVTNMTAGTYDIYAIAVKDLSKYQIDYNTMVVKQNWQDPNEDFWIGKSSIVVTANTTGEVNLNQKYSIIEWHVTNIEHFHKTFHFNSDVITGIAYENMSLSEKDYFTAETENTTTENFLVKKFFTFPGFGSSLNGYCLNQTLTVTLSNGSKSVISTSLQKIEPCKVYTLNVDLTNDSGLKLEKTDWDNVETNL